MRPPIEFRPRRAAVTAPAYVAAQKERTQIMRRALDVVADDAAAQLAHKRAVKAAQMRRWRAKKKTAKR